MGGQTTSSRHPYQFCGWVEVATLWPTLEKHTLGWRLSSSAPHSVLPAPLPSSTHGSCYRVLPEWEKAIPLWQHLALSLGWHLQQCRSADRIQGLAWP